MHEYKDVIEVVAWSCFQLASLYFHSITGPQLKCLPPYQQQNVHINLDMLLINICHKSIE
jgi:hypothetical protein